MPIDSATDKRIAKIGLVGGFIHSFFVVWTHQTIRNESVSQMIVPGNVQDGIIGLYVGIGLVLLGGITVALTYRDRLLTPIGTLVGLFSLATYVSWHSLEETRASGTQPAVTIQPDTLYIFAWFVPLGVVLIVAIVEQTARKRGRAPVIQAE